MAQGSQGPQSQLGPSGPNQFSRGGLQTADVEVGIVLDIKVVIEAFI